jgi:hypothetical protein
MAEEPGERQAAVEVGEDLISLMVPDADPELVQVILSRAAYSASADRADHEGQWCGGCEDQAGLVELLAVIRDVGFGRAQLNTILGLCPEARPADGNRIR